jgi:CheY-like chemotaxis protein
VRAAELIFSATSGDAHPTDGPAPMRDLLVIEDNTDLRDLLAHALRARGYNVIAASSGEDALALASSRQMHPCAVLFEAVLPGLRDVDLIARLRTSDGLTDVPIIAMSGHAMRLEQLDALVDATILKPFGLPAIYEAVERAIARSATPKALLS